MTEDHNIELYKFQKLNVYQLALDYSDTAYAIAARLPALERFNLSDQLMRASTSIILNIAEGSTGQTTAEQSRFLGLALRSYLESIACLDMIERREYLPAESLVDMRRQGHTLFIKLAAFRNTLNR